MNIGFTKMHGLGNDFIVIDNFNGRISLLPEQIVFLCDRHKGIGADGLILVESFADADCFMNYYNADGTSAEMCGNGIRCVAKFLKDNYLKDKTSFKINTRAGMKEIILNDDETFSVNMGKPLFEHLNFPNESKKIDGMLFHFVSMGNPHAVAFEEADIAVIGRSVENNKMFPNKINVELVEEKEKGRLKVKVWERGCGETLCCGTGACAVYAIARKRGIAESKMILEMPGGELELSENEKEEIILKGPAKTAFDGMVEV